MNSAILTTTTHKRLKGISDGMSTQVEIQMIKKCRIKMIKKCRIKMIKKELYNVEELP